MRTCGETLSYRCGGSGRGARPRPAGCSTRRGRTGYFFDFGDGPDFTDPDLVGAAFGPAFVVGALAVESCVVVDAVVGAVVAVVAGMPASVITVAWAIDNVCAAAVLVVAAASVAVLVTALVTGANVLGGSAGAVCGWVAVH